MALKFYVARRCMEIIPVVLGIIVISFVLMHLAPGDPATLLAGEMAPPEIVEQLRHQFGLDRPLHEQLLIYIGNVLQGNLGFSFKYRQPTVTIIFERAPATILLVVTGLIISIIAGTVGGVISARRYHSLVDYVVSSLSLAGYSMPMFWVAQLLVLLSVYVRFFPTFGMTSLREQLTGLAYCVDVLWHLILPALSISITFSAVYARLTKTAVLEAVKQKYIVTAYAKGLTEKQVFYKHALRNSLLPTITYAGMQFGLVLGGAVLIETVFGWPGLGRLLADSIFVRDYPVVMGMFIVLSIVAVVVQVATDILYAMIDPRISYK